MWLPGLGAGVALLGATQPRGDMAFSTINYLRGISGMRPSHLPRRGGGSRVSSRRERHDAVRAGTGTVHCLMRVEIDVLIMYLIV